MNTVYLYRQRGAIGGATHWANTSIGDSDTLEFLGLGTILPAGTNKITGVTHAQRIMSAVYVCSDIEQVQS